MLEENNNCAIIGAGRMGSQQAKAWKRLGYGVVIADITEPQRIAEDIGACWLQIGKDFISELKDYEVWNISSPTSQHFAHLLAALDLGAKKILLEKPSTGSLQSSRAVLNLGREVLIQVDYLERAQKVMRAATEWMRRKFFYPNNIIFNRSYDLKGRIKNGGVPEDFKWVTFNNLCHDVSELEIILQNTWWRNGKTPREIMVKRAQMVSWLDRYGSEFPFAADVESKFELGDEWERFSAHVHGANDSVLHRYFVATDWWRAIWVTTLPRKTQGIFPGAVAVYGRSQVRELIKLAESKEGLPNHFDAIAKLRAELGGKWLLADFEPSAAENMVKNLHEAKTEADLDCSLSTALWIEETIYKVYEKAGLTRS